MKNRLMATAIVRRSLNILGSPAPAVLSENTKEIRLCSQLKGLRKNIYFIYSCYSSIDIRKRADEVGLDRWGSGY
jgi:hypothetical protein